MPAPECEQGSAPHLPEGTQAAGTAIAGAQIREAAAQALRLSAGHKHLMVDREYYEKCVAAAGDSDQSGCGNVITRGVVRPARGAVSVTSIARTRVR